MGCLHGKPPYQPGYYGHGYGYGHQSPVHCHGAPQCGGGGYYTAQPAGYVTAQPAGYVTAQPAGYYASPPGGYYGGNGAGYYQGGGGGGMNTGLAMAGAGVAGLAGGFLAAEVMDELWD
eukprot:TRINITY_DN7068_c0_g1_i1.p1 TRINITY_DN7068_c0_g1~~TRINITY_DN7068_c0_g1_i1.p1  ORF type:complete len:119 (+),score=35.26 TRINITY_DN7068_c0_g1_i1:81-437(+)